MTGFDDPDFSGDHWAAAYGDLSGGPDPTATVDFLAALAAPGARVLELGIGAGRVALPLAARGLRVEGIEASAAVAERLAARPGGERVPVVIDDMADVAVDGPFSLVYVVWNGLFNLTRQERQVECFANVARVLEPGGLFVVECFVPDRGEFGEGVYPREVDEASVIVTITKHDPVEQPLTRQHISFANGGVTLVPVALRYSWPSEIDLMARLAGLELRSRFGDWAGTPFDASSSKHVSVYALPYAGDR